MLVNHFVRMFFLKNSSFRDAYIKESCLEWLSSLLSPVSKDWSWSFHALFSFCHAPYIWKAAEENKQNIAAVAWRLSGGMVFGETPLLTCLMITQVQTTETTSWRAWTKCSALSAFMHQTGKLTKVHWKWGQLHSFPGLFKIHFSTVGSLIHYVTAWGSSLKCRLCDTDMNSSNTWLLSYFTQQDYNSI